MITTNNIKIYGKIHIKEANILPTSQPIISPNGGSFSSSVQITITTPTAGAQIYYTLDGSEPSTSATLYAAPFFLHSSTVAIKAIAYATGMSASNITTSASFTILSAANWITNPISSNNIILNEQTNYIASDSWLTYNGNNNNFIISEPATYVAGADNAFMVWQGGSSNNIIPSPTTYIQGT